MADRALPLRSPAVPAPPRRRRWLLLSLPLLLLAGSAATARAQEAQEVSVDLPDFTRPGPYPYPICNQQPGMVGLEEEKEKTSMCVPIGNEELEFCADMAYDACLRLPQAGLYDDLASDAYTLALDQWKNEFAEAAARQGGCEGALKAYWCAMAFPRCQEYRAVDEPQAKSLGLELELVETPICWDFCMSTEMACIGDKEQATAACLQQVRIGKVSPDRADMVGPPQCQSGAWPRALRALAVLACWAAVAVAVG